MNWGNFPIFANRFAEIAQLVERWLPKPKVAGPSPVFRSTHKNGCKSDIYWFDIPNERHLKGCLSPYLEVKYGGKLMINVEKKYRKTSAITSTITHAEKWTKSEQIRVHIFNWISFHWRDRSDIKSSCNNQTRRCATESVYGIIAC